MGRVGLACALIAAAVIGAHARTAAAAGWCGGTQEVVADREPDVLAGDQVHVVYAVPSDGADRFAEVAPKIATDLADVDAWWRSQDPTRTPRFDFYAFPGCDAGFGRLDISMLRLPHDAAYYDRSRREQADRFTLDAQVLQPSQYKKYLVYYDGPATQTPEACGYMSGVPDDSNLGYAFAVLFLQRPDCGEVGIGGYMAAAAAHEITHSLGAVPAEAPHVCDGTNAHVCDGSSDLMSATPQGGPLASEVLDIGHDDYYGHSGDWWDVQDSPWLERLDLPQYALTIHYEGPVGGRIASDLPGVDCTSTCTVQWQAGTAIALDPTVEGASVTFDGWGRGCASVVEDECTVAMTGPLQLVARFSRVVDVAVVVTGRGGATGTVSSSAGDTCNGDGPCSFGAPRARAFELRAEPDPGSVFAGWSGACAGRGACRLTASAAKRVAAVFAPARERVAVSVSGRGSVASVPASLGCSARCSAAFPYAARVRLVAHPAKGWRFAGWGGACAGPGRCFVTATAAHAVSARFVPAYATASAAQSP